MTRRAEAPCPRDPIGLSREEAARFVGISAASFDKMVISGEMPRAHAVLSRQIWDAEELMTAFKALPRVGSQNDNEENPAGVWGDLAP